MRWVPPLTGYFNSSGKRGKQGSRWKRCMSQADLNCIEGMESTWWKDQWVVAQETIPRFLIEIKDTYVWSDSFIAIVGADQEQLCVCICMPGASLSSIPHCRDSLVRSPLSAALMRRLLMVGLCLFKIIIPDPFFHSWSLSKLVMFSKPAGWMVSFITLFQWFKEIETIGIPMFQCRGRELHEFRSEILKLSWPASSPFIKSHQCLHQSGKPILICGCQLTLRLTNTNFSTSIDVWNKPIEIGGPFWEPSFQCFPWVHCYSGLQAEFKQNRLLVLLGEVGQKCAIWPGWNSSSCRQHFFYLFLIMPPILWFDPLALPTWPPWRYGGSQGP